MTQSTRLAAALLLVLGLGSGLRACTCYEAAPGTYALPGPFDRSWSAALGALVDGWVRITRQDSIAGTASGVRNGIEVKAAVRTQAD
jgi:hypothetical protein